MNYLHLDRAKFAIFWQYVQ